MQSRAKNILFIIALTILFPVLTAAQGNAFNFQGRLNDGTNPANGQYDLQFGLFNAIAGGTQIGSTVNRPNTVLVGGVFSVTLDFGATAFNNPNSVFIEIGVKPAGSPNAFTILGPRQQLTVVPFAVRAANATNADTATNSTNAVNATNAQNAVSAGNSFALGGITSSSYALKNGPEFIRNQTTIQPDSNFNISGNGIINGDLSLEGDIRQVRFKGGAVKAMALIRVTRTGFPNFPTASATVVRCFSGTALPSEPNCGITFGTVARKRCGMVDRQEFRRVARVTIWRRIGQGGTG